MGVWRRRHAAPARSRARAIAYGSCGSPPDSSLPTVTEGPSLNIIGISGFEGSIPFKRSRSPNLDEREYRISQGHDSAAALVVDGTVVAAVAEERISRRKHTGDFPKGAIAYCLAEAGLAMNDVHELAHGFDYAPYRGVYALDPVSHDLYRDVYSREALLALVARDVPGFPAERVRHVAHHAAHAASAYYTSGWDECLVVVIDGMGEAQSASVYHARDGHLDRIFQIGAPDSIGILYSVVTLHLGFDFNADEYKIMGLAPYGDAERFCRFFEAAVELEPDGGIRIPLLRLNRTREEREHYLATRARLTEALVPPRPPDAEIGDVHRDVGAGLWRRGDRRGARGVRRPHRGGAFRDPGRGVRRGGASHCGGTGGRLVPRSHGVRAARPRAPQHPRRPRPRRDAGSHQRHGEDAGGVPAVRSRRLARGSGSLVRGGARNRAAVHDHDRGRAPGVPGCPARHHPRQRLRPRADGGRPGQSGISRPAAGCRQDHGAADGAEHELQRQGTAHPQHAARGARHVPRDGDRVPVPREYARQPAGPLGNVCTSDRGAGGRGGGRFTRAGLCRGSLAAVLRSPRACAR